MILNGEEFNATHGNKAFRAIVKTTKRLGREDAPKGTMISFMVFECVTAELSRFARKPPSWKLYEVKVPSDKSVTVECNSVGWHFKASSLIFVRKCDPRLLRLECSLIVQLCDLGALEKGIPLEVLERASTHPYPVNRTFLDVLTGHIDLTNYECKFADLFYRYLMWDRNGYKWSNCPSYYRNPRSLVVFLVENLVRISSYPKDQTYRDAIHTFDEEARQIFVENRSFVMRMLSQYSQHADLFYAEFPHLNS